MMTQFLFLVLQEVIKYRKKLLLLKAKKNGVTL